MSAQNFCDLYGSKSNTTRRSKNQDTLPCFQGSLVECVVRRPIRHQKGRSLFETHTFRDWDQCFGRNHHLLGKAPMSVKSNHTVTFLGTFCTFTDRKYGAGHFEPGTER